MFWVGSLLTSLCTLSSMSLDKLFRAAKGGEPQAKERLFKQLRLELIPYFRRRVIADDVDDLVQETLEIILREFDEFEPRTPRGFRSYVLQTALNRVRSHRRKIGSRQREEHELSLQLLVAPAREPSPEEVTLAEQRGALLRGAFEVLRTTLRRALEGRLGEEPPQALADGEGLEPVSMRGRVRRGLAALRVEVQARRKTRKTLNVTLPTPT